MADNSLSIAYWKDLKLGDFIESRPRVRVVHTPPEFKGGISLKKARTHVSGPAARYEVRMKPAFRRGWNGTESRSQFWDRVNQFLVDIVDRIGPETGHSQFGPLAIIRDPNGGRTGEQDLTTLDGLISAGTNVNMMLDDDAQSMGWAVDQYVYFIDPANPSTFDYEYAQLTIVGVGGQAQVDQITYDKQDAALVYRAERVYPEMGIIEDIDTAIGGAAAADFVHEIEIAFAGTIDFLAGDLS